MKLQETDDRAELWGMPLSDPPTPVACPSCGKPLAMQGDYLYWCADEQQGYRDVENGDN